MGVSLLHRNPEGEGKGEGVEERERERGEPEAALGETEAVAPLVHQLAARPAGEAAGRGGTPCWTAASPPACRRSRWTGERSCLDRGDGAVQVADA
jgi:hypothetical protein